MSPSSFYDDNACACARWIESFCQYYFSTIISITIVFTITFSKVFLLFVCVPFLFLLFISNLGGGGRSQTSPHGDNTIPTQRILILIKYAENTHPQLRGKHSWAKYLFGECAQLDGRSNNVQIMAMRLFFAELNETIYLNCHIDSRTLFCMYFAQFHTHRFVNKEWKSVASAT